MNAEAVVAEVVSSLADPKCDQTRRQAAEAAFESSRDAQPLPTLAALLQYATSAAANPQNVANITPQVIQACVTSSLVLLRRTLPTVWKHIAQESDREQIIQKLMDAFLDTKKEAGERKRLAHCIEKMLTSRDCNGPSIEKFRNELIPLLGAAMDRDLTANLQPVLQLLVDGLETPTFWMYVCMPHQAKMEHLLLVKFPEGPSTTAEAQQNIKELQALLFLRIVNWIDSDKIPQQLVTGFVPTGVLQVLAQSSNTDRQKSILEGLDEAAGKNLFSSMLADTIRICLEVGKKDPEELGNSSLQSILSLVEAESLEDLKGKNAQLLQEVLLIVLEKCCQIDVESYDSWCQEGNQEDDTEEEVSQGLEALDRLVRKSKESEDEDDEEEESGTEPFLLPVVFEKLGKLDKSNWGHNVATLLILQYVLQYVETSSTLQMITKMALDATKAQNARERFAGWVLLGELTSSKRQFCVRDEESKAAWLETLTYGLENESIQRVLAKSLDAFMYFLAEDQCLEFEDIQPLSERMLKRLVVIIDQADAVFDTRTTNKDNQGGAALGDSTPSTASPASSANGSAVQNANTHHNLSTQMKLLLNVQVSAVGCITAVSKVLDEKVAAFYHSLMPVLYKLLEKHVHSTDSRELLGAAIECASSLGMYLNDAETFGKDAAKIAKAMCHVLQTATMADDPVKDYAFAAADNLITVMKKDFLPFLPVFLPEVYARLKKEGFDAADGKAMERLRAEEDVGGPQVDVSLCVRVDPATGQQKILCIKTAYIDDLYNALSVLKKFIDVLSVDFAPFVDECMTHLKPVLQFDYDDDVRATAVEVYAEIVKLCARSNNTPALKLLVSEFISSALSSWQTNEATKVCDPTRMRTQADGLDEVLNAAGPHVLSLPEVEEVGKACMRELQAALQREGKAEGEEDTEAEWELQRALVSAIGALMKWHSGEFCGSAVTHPSTASAGMIDQAASSSSSSSGPQRPQRRSNANKYTPTGTSLFAGYSQFLVQCITGPDPEAQRIGRLIAADFFEHLGPESVQPLWPSLLPKLVQSVHTKRLYEEVQAAAFALSMAVNLDEFYVLSSGNLANNKEKIAAQEGENKAANNALSIDVITEKLVAERCAAYINKIRTSNREVSFGKETACDNCLACLGNLLTHDFFREQAKEQATSTTSSSSTLSDDDRSRLFRGWISCLPLRADEEEGLRVHTQLVELVLKQYPLVVENLDQAVKAITLLYKGPMSDEDLNEKIGRIVSGVSTAMLERAISDFPAKLKSKVRRIYEDCAGNTSK
ncbi:unnamed protein product [Amoebophrya sp. A25]|nr:unnamed protein product [Amoebophrya sp. A25]|eukprot:GSA25T00017376001.1